MPLNLPDAPSYQSGRWRIVSNAARFVSPISRVGQYVARPGNFWAGSITVPPIRSPIIAGRWGAFGAQIAGGEQSFYLFPPLANIHDVNGTSPEIDGADQVGQTINLRGFDPGDLLRAGGFFSFDTYTFRSLHIVIGDAVADVHGEMSVNIRPGIRRSPEDGAPVTVSYPSCEMVVQQSDVDLLTLTEACWYGFTFDCVEDVRE